MDDRAEQLRSLAIDRAADARAAAARGEKGRGRIFIAVGLLAALVVTAAAARLVMRSLAPAAPVETASSEASPAPPGAAAASTPAPAPAPVRAGRLTASGYVTARTQATASAEITGRIIEVLVEEGDVVAAGDVLARLDSVRAEIDLDLAVARAAAAEALVDQTEADLEEARRVLARTRALESSTVYTEAALTADRARVESLAAQLRAAEAQLGAAQLEVASQRDYVERHLVRAPFGGVVIARNAQTGEIISPVSAGGGFTRTGVATIVDMSSLEIEVDVNEGSIEQVKPGQPVDAVLDAYPGWRIPAHVLAIIPAADRSRATIKVRIAFDELDPRIFPDMAARVTFVDE